MHPVMGLQKGGQVQNFGHYFSKFMNIEIVLKKLFPSLFACLRHTFSSKDFLLLLKLNQRKEIPSRMLIR